MVERVLLSNLTFNEEFARKAIPFLKEEYFHDAGDQVVFNLISDYVTKYNTLPSREALYIDLSNKDNLNENQFKGAREIIQNLEVDNKTDVTWLLEQAEKFCQEKAVHNALRTSISILNDRTGQLSKGSIPKILSDALAVSFDSNVGHDFLVDALHRYDLYHLVENKIPFDIDLFNKITKNGLANKTLTVILASTGVGKTLVMAHMAASNLMMGKNVLYITMEMSEEKIAERIDANMLDVKLDDLLYLTKDQYENKINNLSLKTKGKLIIKEYPTASAGSANFRYLLHELKIKKNFIPDIIYVDYINICMSSRLKFGANVNSYTYIKSIAEELRGLAVEFNLPLVTATQTNRAGYNNSDPGLDNTSESFGLPATADLMFALISSEQLEQLGQYLVKQLKNRYSNMGRQSKFVIGVDKDKMRLFDVEQSAQEDITNDKPVMDSSPFNDDNDMLGSKDLFKGFK